MCRLAASESGGLVRHAGWETEREEWPTTRQTLDAYREQMRAFAAGATPRPEWIGEGVTVDEVRTANMYLLCGDDLLESFNTPGLWSPEDVSIKL